MEFVQNFVLNRISLADAEERVPPAFIRAYQWFQDNEDVVLQQLPSGSRRPQGTAIPIVHPQRGIHKPAAVIGYKDYALSIKSSGKDIYADRVFDQGDGTWILWYSEQKKAELSTETSKDVYNRALMNCLVDGIPVGVFIKLPGSDSNYLCKGLAFIESYDEARGLFCLHGPVRSDQPADYWSLVDSDELVEVNDSGEEIEITEKDERRIDLVRKAIRYRQDKFRSELLNAYEGACAVTGYAVEPALQAAHISSYRGPESQKTSNGLLLRADVHLLYDAHLASVDPETMRFVIAPKIKDSAYSGIDRTEIRLPVYQSDMPSTKRLQTHFAEFRRRHAI